MCLRGEDSHSVWPADPPVRSVPIRCRSDHPGRAIRDTRQRGGVPGLHIGHPSTAIRVPSKESQPVPPAQQASGSALRNGNQRKPGSVIGLATVSSASLTGNQHPARAWDPVAQGRRKLLDTFERAVGRVERLGVGSRVRLLFDDMLDQCGLDRASRLWRRICQNGRHARRHDGWPLGVGVLNARACCCNWKWARLQLRTRSLKTIMCFPRMRSSIGKQIHGEFQLLPSRSAAPNRRLTAHGRLTVVKTDASQRRVDPAPLRVAQPERRDTGA